MKDIIPEKVTQRTFDFDVLPQKYCPVCKEWYSATSEFFHHKKTAHDGLHPYCKECVNAYNRARYERKTPLPEVLPEGFRRCTQCKEVKAETEEYFFLNGSRNTFRAECKICRAITSKTYRAKHAKGQKTRAHQYYIRNIETLKEKAHQRYLDHIDYYREKMRIYRTEKADYIKAYRKAHPETARVSNRKRRSLKRASGSFTAKQIQEQNKRQKGRCYYCKKKVGKNYHIEHVVPLARGGSNDISNIVIACPTCNMCKQDKLPHEWPQGGRLL